MIAKGYKLNDYAQEAPHERKYKVGDYVQRYVGFMAPSEYYPRQAKILDYSGVAEYVADGKFTYYYQVEYADIELDTIRTGIINESNWIPSNEETFSHERAKSVQKAILYHADKLEYLQSLV